MRSVTILRAVIVRLMTQAKADWGHQRMGRKTLWHHPGSTLYQALSKTRLFLEIATNKARD